MKDDQETTEAPRRNSVDGSRLRGFIERVERLRDDKKALADDERVVFAEAKAEGYTPKYLRAILKLRTLKPSEREENEAMMDLYLSAMGMAKEAPLFRAVGAMDVDLTARQSVVAALKMLAPLDGEIIVKVGGEAVRIYRDADGEPQAEDHVDHAPPPPPPTVGARPQPRPKADVPSCTEDEAEELGRQAAREDKPVIANPFPWDDKRRPRWDLGWRREAGSDGMGPNDPGAPGGAK